VVPSEERSDAISIPPFMAIVSGLGGCLVGALAGMAGFYYLGHTALGAERAWAEFAAPFFGDGGTEPDRQEYLTSGKAGVATGPETVYRARPCEAARPREAAPDEIDSTSTATLTRPVFSSVGALTPPAGGFVGASRTLG
jgi:hypothetical protein